ncbi:MAG: hypothetical protein ACT4QA_15655, partial [Panacagrimonas sp.]
MKAFWKSKTLLFNVVGAAAAVLPQLDQLLPAVQTVLPNHYYELLSAVLVVGNSVLRTITSVGVS